MGYNTEDIIYVVFTFQKEGRCNIIDMELIEQPLFLPFKKKADATCSPESLFLDALFLPFKKKADATFYACHW